MYVVITDTDDHATFGPFGGEGEAQLWARAHCGADGDWLVVAVQPLHDMDRGVYEVVESKARYKRVWHDDPVGPLTDETSLAYFDRYIAGDR